MQITPLIGLSAVLIAGGLLLLLRDLFKKRRYTVLQHDVGHDCIGEHITLADVDITYPEAPTDRSVVNYLQPPDSPLSELRDTIARVSAELTEHETPGREQSSQVEQDWADLQARIDNAIQSINKVVRDVSLVIGPQGQPGWSYNNHGFGSFRRLMLADESIAWMRMELMVDKRFVCAIRSHGDDMAALNSNESIAANALTDNRIAGLISAAMQPITKYAARNGSKMMSEQEASEVIWQETEELVMEAVEGASKALSESGSSLEPLGPAEWDGAAKRYRFAARVMLDGEQVAKIFIERPTVRHIECHVVPPNGSLVALSRRHRVDTTGLSVAKLAELYVSCAWPSIEHAWNDRHAKPTRTREAALTHETEAGSSAT